MNTNFHEDETADERRLTQIFLSFFTPRGKDAKNKKVCEAHPARLDETLNRTDQKSNDYYIGHLYFSWIEIL